MIHVPQEESPLVVAARKIAEVYIRESEAILRDEEEIRRLSCAANELRQSSDERRKRRDAAEERAFTLASAHGIHGEVIVCKVGAETYSVKLPGGRYGSRDLTVTRVVAGVPTGFEAFAASNRTGMPEGSMPEAVVPLPDGARVEVNKGDKPEGQVY